MRIGMYIDGRDLTYDESTTQFAVGGTQVTLEQVLQYDAFNQIQWTGDETRDWILALQEWMESQDSGVPRTESDSTRIADEAQASTQASPQAASPPSTSRSIPPVVARWLWGLLALVVIFVVVTLLTGVVECGGASVLLVIVLAVSMRKESARQSASMAMICPHCQTKGSVRTKSITQKKGVSGGKATAAIMTGGASMLATGLSRKEPATEAHCSHCGATWRF